MAVSVAALAVEAAPLAAVALQAFFTAANDHHGQRHNEATLLRENAEIYHIGYCENELCNFGCYTTAVKTFRAQMICYTLVFEAEES